MALNDACLKKKEKKKDLISIQGTLSTYACYAQEGSMVLYGVLEQANQYGNQGLMA